MFNISHDKFPCKIRAKNVIEKDATAFSVTSVNFGFILNVITLII